MTAVLEPTATDEPVAPSSPDPSPPRGLADLVVALRRLGDRLRPSRALPPSLVDAVVRRAPRPLGAPSSTYADDLVRAARVAELRAAVADLDARGPADWRDRVDVDVLDMYHVKRCVLGQVYGDYDHGREELYARSATLRLGPGDRAFRADFPRDLWVAELTGVPA